MGEIIQGNSKLTKNLRIVVDSNFLVVLFLNSSGYSADVLRYIKEYHTLIMSDYIVYETLRVVERLAKKLQYSPRKVNSWRLYLPQVADVMIVLPTDYTKIAQPYIRDKKDSGIFITALLARANVLISNDKDLLENKKVKKYIDVVRLEGFEEYIKKSLTARERLLLKTFLKKGENAPL